MTKTIDIPRLKAEVGIEEVLRHYGADLGGWDSGQWRSIRCPFHDDTHKSASYSPTHSRFKCFTCDVQGDILDLVQYAEQCSFKDAVDYITRRIR